jgi:hypothetical protein
MIKRSNCGILIKINEINIFNYLLIIVGVNIDKILFMLAVLA